MRRGHESVAECQSGNPSHSGAVMGYSPDGSRIRREWRVKDFAAGLDFFRRVGELSEADGHHPDLHLVSYRQEAIELWTQAASGLTENDFILAAKIDEISPSPSARVESPAAVVNGKLYMFDGFTEDLEASNQVDVYDPANDSWARKKDMPARLTHLNPGSDGKTIWFAGGFKGKHPGLVTGTCLAYR